MSRNVAKRAARKIADEIISAARNSGTDPIAWVTGNSYMPPLRSFDAAERIYQLPGNSWDAWESLAERIEEHLSAASVAVLGSLVYDNALYAVDLERFEYSGDETGDTLQDDWIVKEA